MENDRVKQKLKEFLRAGKLNDLAEQIVSDLSDEEAAVMRDKFEKLTGKPLPNGELNKEKN